MPLPEVRVPDHLHRLLGGPRRDRGTSRTGLRDLHQESPRTVGQGPLDQCRRAERSRSDPRAGDQVRPPPAGDRRPVVDRPAAEARGYTAEGGRPPYLFLIVRMIQLVDKKLESEQISMFVGKQIVVTIQETPRRHLGPDPRADREARLTPARARRELPRLRVARRDRRPLLPGPRALRRPARGARGPGPRPARPRHDRRDPRGQAATSCCCGAPSGRCARSSTRCSASRTSA